MTLVKGVGNRVNCSEVDIGSANDLFLYFDHGMKAKVHCSSHSEGMGKVLFSQVSVCSHFGVGGVGHVHLADRGVPLFFPTGVTLILPDGGGGYPILPNRGVPHLRSEWGYPILLMGWYPIWSMRVPPPFRTGRWYPLSGLDGGASPCPGLNGSTPVRRQSSIARRRTFFTKNIF